MKPRRAQTAREEVANAATHGIGIGLSIAALCVMVVTAARADAAWHVAGCIVFGASMIILYGVSTTYHLVRGERAKNVMRRLDHCSIYILIAGSYTPFTLTTLRGPLGWTLFAVVWGIAIVGIALKMIRESGGDRAPTLGYLLMSWLVLFAAYPMYSGLSWACLVLVVAGGFSYTFGVVFYLNSSRVHYFHAVWHLFVIGGTTCHFFSVLWNVPV